MSETPFWNFHCTAAKLSNGNYHVRLETKSGRVFERTGYNPLWELMRIMAHAKKGTTK